MIKWRDFKTLQGSATMAQATHKIFIDGQAGTTGLKIHDYLKHREDLELLVIPEKDRKDQAVKQDLLNNADIVVLCLPDEAAIETVRLASDSPARILDASTAHRVAPGWTYGLPELGEGRREEIKQAKFVSNPGCYPTGFLLPVAPLTREGLLKKDSPIATNALSGYSGGGRTLIERYEERARHHPEDLWYCRPYSLHLAHKHVPEMTVYAGLDKPPIFLPSVGHFAQGMLVNVPLFKEFLADGTTMEQIHDTIASCYADEPCVEVHPANSDSELDHGFLDPQGNNGTNRVDIFIFGSDEQILLVSRLDNLGKGASGAALQNLNLMTGADELHGLCV